MARKNKSSQQQPQREKESPSFLRLKIPLNDSGEPDLSDWDAHDTTKERYRNLISSQEFQKKIGLLQTSGKSPQSSVKTDGTSETKDDAPLAEKEFVRTDVGMGVSVLKPAEIVWVFDVYTAIMAFVFSQILKSEYDVVYPCVKFDDEQKEVMAEPLCEIVLKYCPSEWLIYLPEFRLGMMLAGITGANFARAREAAVAHKKEKPAPSGTSHVVTMDNKTAGAK